MTMLRNASVVLRGMVVAQVIGLVALPLMTRLLPVEAFGQIQVYLSIISIGLVFASMRYEIAILRCRSKSELRATLHLCLFLNIGVAIIAGLGFEAFRIWGGSSTVSNLAFGGGILAMALLINGFVQTLGYVVTREEAFSEGANAKIAQSLVYASAGSGLGYVAPSQLTLVVSDILGKAAAVAYLVGRIRRFELPGLERIQPRRILASSRKYRHYAMLTVPGSLLGTLSLAMVPFGIFTLYGAHAAGQYGLMERAVLLPVNLIVVALSQVFTAKLARELRAGGSQGRTMFRQMVAWCAMVGIVPTIIGYWLISPIVLFVFGPEWRLAAEIARILIIYNFFSFVVGGVLFTLIAGGAQRQQVLWDLGRFCAAVLVWIVIVKLALGIKTALAIHYSVQTVGYGVYLLLGDRMLADSHRKIPPSPLPEPPLPPAL